MPQKPSKGIGRIAEYEYMSSFQSFLDSTMLWTAYLLDRQRYILVYALTSVNTELYTPLPISQIQLYLYK